MESTGNWAAKHRPTTLEDFCGQEAAKAQIAGLQKSSSLPGCIGIMGTTGMGKTTLARLLANSFTDSPDTDLIERDMGTHGNIEDVRKLASLARFKPRGKIRVIILDELHLVSKTASSTLLKLLEEPPPRTVFIWCTDQPEKVLKTLLGRSFKIYLQEEEDPTVIVPFMSKVCKKEGLKFGSIAEKKKILVRIAELSGGEPRTAINTLEEFKTSMLGQSSTKQALSAVLARLDSVMPAMVATKFLLGIYTKRRKAAASAIFDFKGTGWKQLIDTMLFMNTAVFNHSAAGASSAFPIGPRKLLLAKMKEKGVPSSQVSFELAAYVQNALVDILKEFGTYSIPPQAHVPARLAAIAVKACRQ